MYIAESDGATGCMNCDTTDNGNESPYRLMNSSQADSTCYTVQPIDITDKRKPMSCNSITKAVCVILLIITSVLGLIFPPLNFILWEKLNMRPGLPPFDWWADPPDEVKMRIHVFNVTNHERFMAGLDAKLNFEDIGPIVYLEKLTHTNIRFNDNDTMTYTSTRRLIYLPELNTIDMNATIIVPNMAVLGLCSYLHDSFLARMGIKWKMSQHHSQLFVKKTIHEFMWDFQDPLLEEVASIAPGLLPITNLGILSVIYNDFVDEITVKVGPRWGHKQFFRIDKMRGSSQMALYDPDVCPDRVTDSTEGVMYPQYLTKHDVLLYLRKTVCKVVPLYFESEVVMEGVPVYRYNLSENIFDRITNRTDCYATVPALPNGITDTSKCFFNFPLAASYPHFYTGFPAKDTYVTGLTPDKNKHNSYVYVEPNTGIPFQSVARMQCNLRVHDTSLYGSKDLRKFSNLILPLAWIEYKQEGLPSHMIYTIYFMVVILPPLANVVFSITLAVCTLIIFKKLYKIPKIFSLFKRRKTELESNKIRVYEQEMFINSRK